MGTELNKLLDILADKLILLSLIIPFTALALMVSLSQRATRRITTLLPAIMPVLTAGFVLTYIVAAVHYVFFIELYDHVEPSVVTIVRLLNERQPVYHDLFSASRYSLQYGPNSFIVPWLAIKALGDSIISFKLVSAFFALGALGLVWAAIRASFSSRFARQAGLIYFCSTSLLFLVPLVWIRADSQMLFWVALGLYGATRRNSLIAFAVMGVAAGACLNAKVHGVLFFIPIMALVRKGDRWLYWAWFAGAAAATAVAPFLLVPEVSFSNYFLWLKMVTRHGFAVEGALNSFVLAGFLFIPLALVAVYKFGARSPAEQQEWLRKNRNRWALAATGVGALILVASKKGAGEWHLLPLVPVVAWLLASLLNPDEIECSRPPMRGIAGCVLTALLAVALCNGAVALIYAPKMVYYFNRSNTIALKAIMADAKDVTQKLSGQTVAMGYGGDQSYPVTYARVALPVQTGLVLDPAALMDMHLSGLALPQATLDALRAGVVKIWLVPKGEIPFSMTDYYQRQDLFGQELRQTFSEHYKKIGQSRFFDVWGFDH